MRFSTSSVAAALLSFATFTSAVKVFQSSSLDVCQDDSIVTASLFRVVFTPDNKTVSVDVVGESQVTGNFTLDVEASAYGYSFLKKTVNPCDLGLQSLCPLTSPEISFDQTFRNISTSIIGSIPGIAFGIPDLDAVVQVNIFKTEAPTVRIGCVRIEISNGRTVNQTGVKWTTGIIAIIGLLASAVVSGLGHANTAAHVTLYVTALFSYFQTMALVGLCAIPLPPIVLAWTQDFVWSLGIIRVGFLQKLARWYQISTGGKPTTVLQTLGSKSVQVAKRALEFSGFANASTGIARREAITATAGGGYIVTGIQRAAFVSKMEPTNLFMTCIIFFCIFVIFTVLMITLFKFALDLAVRAGWTNDRNHKFQTFHNHWRVTMKGVIFRLILIGFLPIATVSLWEFTANDSPAEIILAILFFFGMTVTLGLATFRVISIARRSEHLHKTPAYMLYSDAGIFKKWGFLFIPFRASAYWYIAPALAYILLKAIFVGLAQSSGIAQAIGFLIIEAIALITVSVIRPYMDKPANSMHIAICAINFVNAIFLLIFTDVFNGPGLLIGVVGVVFFFMNAIFGLILLIIVLFAAIFSMVRKNPETRYQPMGDNRGSFIKSQTALTTELDMLGASARGDSRMSYLGHNDSNASLDLTNEKAMHHPMSRAQPTTRGSSTSEEIPLPRSPGYAPRNGSMDSRLGGQEKAYGSRLGTSHDQDGFAWRPGTPR